VSETVLLAVHSEGAAVGGDAFCVDVFGEETRDAVLRLGETADEMPSVSWSTER
jgi:hypothetical protein